MTGLTIADPAFLGAAAAKRTIRESFNKANGALGPDLTWTTTAGSIGVVSNRAQNTGASLSVTDARAESALATSDQYAQITCIRNTPDTSQDAARVCARFSETARTHYFVGLLGNNTYQIFRRVLGTATSLASGSYTWANNDVLRIEVSGATITLKVNGSTVASATDSNITSGLYTGIGFADIVYQSDNFEAGDL